MVIPEGLLEELRDSKETERRSLARKRRSIKSRVAPDDDEEDDEQFEIKGA